MLLRFSHPQNIPNPRAPNVITLSGIAMSVIPVQYENAPTPISVTLLGIVIFVRFTLYINAPSATMSTPSGITNELLLFAIGYWISSLISPLYSTPSLLIYAGFFEDTVMDLRLLSPPNARDSILVIFSLIVMPVMFSQLRNAILATPFTGYPPSLVGRVISPETLLLQRTIVAAPFSTVYL